FAACFPLGTRIVVSSDRVAANTLMTAIRSRRQVRPPDPGPPLDRLRRGARLSRPLPDIRPVRAGRESLYSGREKRALSAPSQLRRESWRASNSPQSASIELYVAPINRLAFEPDETQLGKFDFRRTRGDKMSKGRRKREIHRHVFAGDPRCKTAEAFQRHVMKIQRCAIEDGFEGIFAEQRIRRRQ